MSRPNAVPVDAPEYDALRDALIFWGAPAVLISVSDIARIIGETIQPERAARWERAAIVSDIAGRELARDWEK